MELKKMTFRKFNFRTPYQIMFSQPSQTIQSERDNVDINNIVRRYDSSGFLPADPGTGQYGDVTSLQSKDLTEHLTQLNATAQSLAEVQQQQLEQQQQQYTEFQAWQAAQNSEPAPEPAPPAE